METVRCVFDLRHSVGECPVWDERAQALFWVDIFGPALHRWDPATGARREWRLPSDIGSFALAADGKRAVCALRDGFHWLDLANGATTPIATPDFGGPAMARLNDGRCDRQGRFWAGTMYEPRDRALGALWRLGVDGKATRMLDGSIVSNGLAFSPNSKTMYWSCSRQATLWAFDFDATTGTPSNRRILRVYPEGEGRPDGGTVDAEGFYWSAAVFAGKVVRIDPLSGKVVREIAVPTAFPTMPCFGGPALKTLYVTSLRENRTAEELAKWPLSGGLFAVEVDVPGLPEPRYAG